MASFNFYKFYRSKIALFTKLEVMIHSWW